MAINHKRQPKNSHRFQAALERRLTLLPNFPKDAEISYKWDDDSLGKVTEHDRVNGRVKTGDKGSYDPNDIKALPPKQA